jgi:hypothetical protein
MASHGRGGVSRWLLGSVAEDVLHHTEVPILLIKVATIAEKSPRPVMATAAAMA